MSRDYDVTAIESKDVENLFLHLGVKIGIMSSTRELEPKDRAQTIQIKKPPKRPTFTSQHPRRHSEAFTSPEKQ